MHIYHDSIDFPEKLTYNSFPSSGIFRLVLNGYGADMKFGVRYRDGKSISALLPSLDEGHEVDALG